MGVAMPLHTSSDYRVERKLEESEYSEQRRSLCNESGQVRVREGDMTMKTEVGVV